MTEADLAELGRDELVALILKQAAAIAALQAKVEELARSGKRQAAPFSKGTRAGDPKRPGRKPGRGIFRRREAPAPEQLSEPPIDVPVTAPACPACGECDSVRDSACCHTDDTGWREGARRAG